MKAANREVITSFPVVFMKKRGVRKSTKMRPPSALTCLSIFLLQSSSESGRGVVVDRMAPATTQSIRGTSSSATLRQSALTK
ncbi:hypothetical protein HHI36_011661 [Cryptolaemus montrouzieri]|uniref:Uncharacterized protein n=1 Tax=Cryptolaemus montrouzieri TaxID=559131 RepID=A0ABD2MMC1_9CUCU